MKKMLFALLLGVYLIACNKNKSQCNVEPEKVNLQFVSGSVVFDLYNEASNFLIKPLLNKDSLDNYVALMGIDLIDSINSTNNIVGLSLLFNTSDSSVTNNFNIGDLDGILFYVRNNLTEKMHTIVYRKEAGTNSLIYSEYLSTDVNFITSNDIILLSKVVSSGVDNNLKLSFIRWYEDYIKNDTKYYSEFYYRIVYTGKKDNLNLLTVPKCGGICLVEVMNTMCIMGYSGHVWCGEDEGGPCPMVKGLELATPISYSINDINNSFESQRHFRDNVLLKSKKGVTYTSLYYYIGSKLSISYYINNIDLIFDVVFNSVLPMINRINDESYTGSLYTDDELDGFIDIIESLKTELQNDEMIVSKLDVLMQELIHAKDLDKNALLTEFYEN